MKSIFELQDFEGENKVISLKEAIREYVRPGLMMHIGEGSNAAIMEIIRQYWGTQPGFTLVTPGFSFYAMDMVACGLVKKLITVFAGELYPTPGRSYIFTRAYKEKKVEIELWSLYTLTQRLTAGAQDVPFIPTRSLEGTTIAEENKDSYKLVDDPFGSGKKIGLLKALRPDISIVHGWAADPNGNTILYPQVVSGESAWGALASKEGVVVTVEKVVPTSLIRKYSHLVKIPDYMVKSVSPAPFGAHPQGLTNYGIDEFEAYGDDYDFQRAHRSVTRNQGALQAWLKEWVINSPTHEDYLRQLGEFKINYLKNKAKEDPLQNLPELLQKPLSNKEYNPLEMMIIVASRKIQERIRKEGYKVILSGIGAAGLAAWLAFYDMRYKGYNVDIILGSGFYGLVPRPGDPFITNLVNIPTCKLTGSVTEAYGVIVCGANRKSISLLAGGQVDKYGNINSAKISEDLYLTGVGGAGDAIKASEAILVMSQSKSRFLEKLPYITSTGETVRVLVSNMGVFEKPDGEEEFHLTGYFPSPDKDEIEEIKSNCGWELKISPEVKKIDPPSEKELTLLRLLDPRGDFTGEV